MNVAILYIFIYYTNKKYQTIFNKLEIQNISIIDGDGDDVVVVYKIKRQKNSRQVLYITRRNYVQKQIQHNNN